MITTRWTGQTLTWVMTLLCGMIVAGGCQRPAMLHVPLEYHPTGPLQFSTMSGGLPAGQFLMVTVTDSRTETGSIGKNIEKDAAVPIYADQTTPDQFVRDAVSRELRNAGLSITDNPTQANRTLHLDLRQFWTEESSLYRTAINASAELKAASGRVLWQGGVGGESKRFGRSLSPENYQEVFSDATIDLVQNLLKNEAFLKALQTSDKPPAQSERRRRK